MIKYNNIQIFIQNNKLIMSYNTNKIKSKESKIINKKK